MSRNQSLDQLHAEADLGSKGHTMKKLSSITVAKRFQNRIPEHERRNIPFPQPEAECLCDRHFLYDPSAAEPGSLQKALKGQPESVLVVWEV